MKRFLICALAVLLMATSLTLIAYAASDGTSVASVLDTEGGITVTADDRLFMKELLPGIPTTFEATVKYAADTKETNVIFGNYNDIVSKRPNSLMYYVDEAGRPTFYTRDAKDTTGKYTFTKVKIYTGEWVHLSIVIDGTSIHCYVDGVLKQTLAYTPATVTPATVMVVGGDYRSKNNGTNYAYFRGVMKDLALYSDVRTAEEIKASLTSRDANDANLLCYYKFENAKRADLIPDYSSSGNTLVRERMDGGLTFVQSDKYVSESIHASIPETIEVVFKLPDGFTGRGGVIYSNYAGTQLTNMALHIYSNKQLRVWYENKLGDTKIQLDVVADGVTIPSGEWVHLTMVRDLAGEEWRFYLDGKLADTVKFSEINATKLEGMMDVTADGLFKLGNDYRKDQSVYFKGAIMSLAAYSDVRSEEEILLDVMRGAEKDESLLAYYDMKYAADAVTIPDRSGNGNDIVNTSPTASDDIPGEGMTFTMDNKYVEKYLSAVFPHTVEAVINLPVGDYGHRSILSNYDPAAKTSTYNFRTVNGVPRLVIYTPDGKALEYRFTKLTSAELCTGEWQHLTLVTDTEKREFRVYLNGVLEDTKKFNAPQTMNLTAEEIDALDFDFTLGRPLMLGRNYATTEQYAYPFTGRILSVVTYSDVRTAEEILNDMIYPEADQCLTGYYDLEHVGVHKSIPDRSNSHNDIMASDGDTLIYSQETSYMTFNNDVYYETNNLLTETPLTFEAVVKYPITGNGGNGKVILGNYYGPSTSNTITFKITATDCQPMIYVIDKDGNEYTFLFDKVHVNTEYWEHVAITFDSAAGYAYCYLNGILMQKLPYAGELGNYDWSDAEYPLMLGGDWQSANFECFNRKIKYAALYTDTRTAEEIYESAKNGVNTADGNLLVYYAIDGDFTSIADQKITAVSKGDRYGLTYVDPFFTMEERDPETYDYSFVVVGDTQLITNKYPAKLTALYDWIIANAESKKISFVMGLGDINHNDTDAEWKVSSAAIAKLRDAGVPQSLVCGGGHDTMTKFNKYLPYQDYVDAYDGKIEYGFYDNGSGKYSLSNAYHLFTVGETKYMVLSLEWAPGSGQVAWANEVIAAHPDHNVIITTHAYLFQDGTKYSTYDYPSPDSTGEKDAHNGDELWDALIRKHENIVMVLSGHNAVDRIVKTVSYGDHGNRIVEMLINPQETDTNYNGTGLVAMLYFSDGGRRVDLEYYSTDKLQHFGEMNQFSFDMPVITDEQASINQATVSIGRNINVNYYVYLTGSNTDAVMRFTMNGVTTTVSGKAQKSDGLYVFTYEGVAPHLMGEYITAELIVDGEVVDTATPFSVESYARKLLKLDKYELTWTADMVEALRALLRDLLDYGAAAQNYKDHATDALVNSGVSSESVFDPDAIESVKASGEVLGTSGAKFVGATVRFDSTNYLRFDFTVGTADITSVTVEIGDKVYTSDDFTALEDGNYCIYTEDISANKFAIAYTATVKVDGEAAHTVTYSVNSYVKAMHESEEIGELARAIYHYGVSTEAFIKLISEE